MLSFSDAQAYTVMLRAIFLAALVTLKVWDLRKTEVAMTLTGHTETITGLAVSPDGNHLLSNAMVSKLR